MWRGFGCYPYMTDCHGPLHRVPWSVTGILLAVCEPPTVPRPEGSRDSEPTQPYQVSWHSLLPHNIPHTHTPHTERNRHTTYTHTTQRDRHTHYIPETDRQTQHTDRHTHTPHTYYSYTYTYTIHTYIQTYTTHIHHIYHTQRNR